jgi:hypothetical protein
MPKVEILRSTVLRGGAGTCVELQIGHATPPPPSQETRIEIAVPVADAEFFRLHKAEDALL